MNSAVKIILIVLGVLLGLWAVSQIVVILQALLPLAVLLGLGYVVYRFASKKALPGQSRKNLP
jgi:hypothetical protein